MTNDLPRLTQFTALSAPARAGFSLFAWVIITGDVLISLEEFTKLLRDETDVRLSIVGPWAADVVAAENRFRLNVSVTRFAEKNGKACAPWNAVHASVRDGTSACKCVPLLSDFGSRWFLFLICRVSPFVLRHVACSSSPHVLLCVSPAVRS